jgi:UDP-N-acetylenolpyruvoylglucosamine reductase
METIEHRVFEQYGVRLEREVRFLPDDCYGVAASDSED